MVLVAAIELAIFINQGIPYFTGTVIPGDGVTAQLLKANGIQVVGESRAEELLGR